MGLYLTLPRKRRNRKKEIIQEITGWSWEAGEAFFNETFKPYCLSAFGLGIVAKKREMIESLGVKDIIKIKITVSTFKPKGRYLHQEARYYTPCPTFAPFDYAFVTPKKFFLRVGDLRTIKPRKKHIDYLADKKGAPLEDSSLWYDEFDVGEQEISAEEEDRAVAKWIREGKLHHVHIRRWDCTCGKGHAPKKVWITVRKE